MIEAGLMLGDKGKLLIVGDIVLAMINGEFTILKYAGVTGAFRDSGNTRSDHSKKPGTFKMTVAGFHERWIELICSSRT